MSQLGILTLMELLKGRCVGAVNGANAMTGRLMKWMKGECS